MTSLLSHPALRGERLVFVSEDDLWTVGLDGGQARRLTSARGRVSSPAWSRDGHEIAIAVDEEGVREVMSLDADGGELTRRTWHGAQDVAVIGYPPGDDEVVYRTASGRPHGQETRLLAVARAGGPPRDLGLGPAVDLDWQAGGPGRVLTRNQTDLSRWRRYRGGRVGRIWVDLRGDGAWSQLPVPAGNVACALWCGDRIAFVSDHDGDANLYSASPDGSDLRRLTDHTGFAVRTPTHDAGTIVYAWGWSLWRLDLASGERAPISIRTGGQRAATQPRHPNPAAYLEHAALHPDGHTLALVARGRPFVGGLWEGPLVQRGARDGTRHRLASWLDAERLIWASDAGGVDHLEVCDAATGATRTLGETLGRVDAIRVGTDGRVALIGPHDQLVVLDANTGEHVEVARTGQGPPSGARWSADGRWLTWSHPVSRTRSSIRIARFDGLAVVEQAELTEGRFRDRAPDFDPLGRFLYFLSDRELDPVRDALYSDYGFPRGSRPYLIALRADVADPFHPPARALGKAKGPSPPESLEIELDGIADRVLRFPLAEGRYLGIAGLPSGRVLLQRAPIQGALGHGWTRSTRPDARDELLLWEHETREIHPVHANVTGFALDAPRKTLALRVGDRLRVFQADPDKARRGELKAETSTAANRKTGWVDLGRARLSIDPRAEWRQMLDETWRLMRDNFWDPSLARVDWDEVRARYLPLADRVGTRAELSDVIWAMQGELGTSHAYEIGGDHQPPPRRPIGKLAADFAWDGEGWEILAIHAAEPGDTARSSPLARVGVGARVGERVLAVDGEPVRAELPLDAMLGATPGRTVAVDLGRRDGRVRTAWVRPLADDEAARRRFWVAANRARVHAATGGRAGYLHVPDMGPAGYADFHRDFLAESARDGLIVDVRYNRGGHVSPLLLARLMSRPLGYWVSRAHGVAPYPTHSVRGPMVALANEFSGSDGDIFAHHWRALGLGPLIGTRTWGGVVGIMPRRPLVDRTLTTQPEFAKWVADGTGFTIENQGVTPDIEVVVPPGAPGDPQLDRAIEQLVRALAGSPPLAWPEAPRG